MNSKRHQNSRQRNQVARRQQLFQFETLERRDLMAIALVGTDLQIRGGNYQDEVSIVTVRGGEDIIATRKETRPGQTPTTETKTFPAAAISNIVVNLLGGNDVVNNGSSKTMTAYGGSGNDALTGGFAVDKLFGGLGNDTISGKSGDDQVYGEEGDDNLRGGNGNDKIEGGLGSDFIRGDAGADELLGLNSIAGWGSSPDGSNKIYGGEGNDKLYGAGGIDILVGEVGDDSLIGGGDNDNLWGGDGNDVLSGLSGSDWLEGGFGDDALLGGDGHDKLFGQDGHDKLEGSLGNDELYGGNQNDTLTGDLGNDLLLGNNGHDSLDGGEGNDNLRGGANDDYLTGKAGDDTLIGENGNDTLIGGAGVDYLKGGAGIDKIVAVDGVVDKVFAGIDLTSSERDELWVDNLDRNANQTVIDNARAVDAKAVNVVHNYRSYSVAGVQTTPPLTLGADLDLPDPLPTAEDSGLVDLERYGTSYPLFPTGGLAYTNIDQGATGTCYFLARLSSLAKTHPQHIRDMVTELGDGTYAVKYHNQLGGNVYLRVDSDFYRMDGSIRYANFGEANGMWVAVLEKAWAIHRYGIASYDKIEGGNSATVSTSIALGIFNHYDHFATDYTASSFVQLMKSALTNGRTVILSAPASISDTLTMTAENKHLGQHVYVVHSILSNSSGTPTTVRLYNLYGGALTEITDFARLQYFASKAVLAWP